MSRFADIAQIACVARSIRGTRWASMYGLGTLVKVVACTGTTWRTEVAILVNMKSVITGWQSGELRLHDNCTTGSISEGDVRCIGNARQWLIFGILDFERATPTIWFFCASKFPKEQSPENRRRSKIDIHSIESSLDYWCSLNDESSLALNFF